MRDELKKFFTLNKYALNYKSGLVMAIVFCIIGLLWDLSSIFFPEVFMIGFDAGAYFMVLGGATFAQSSFSVIYVGLGATSMEYRNILLKYSVIFITWFSLFSIALSTVIHIVAFVHSPAILPKMGFSMIQIGLFAFFIQAYFALAYKLYAISSVVFAIVIMPLAYISTHLNIYEKMSEISIPFAIILGFVLTLAGSAAYYGITRLIYRKSFDTLAFRSAMAKAAK